jgi:hemerythrin
MRAVRSLIITLIREHRSPASSSRASLFYSNMMKNHYPGLQEHQAKHEALRRTVADLIQDFNEEGVTSALADAVETLLGNWLIQHIQQVDQRFGKFMQEKK